MAAASMASVTMQAAAAPPPPSSPSSRRMPLAGSPLRTTPRGASFPSLRDKRLRVSASSGGREQAAAVAAGLTAAATVAALVVPEAAEAAQPGLSPSLKNFLLSIVSGGVVLAAILGAVIAVSNFDPVKRT